MINPWLVNLQKIEMKLTIVLYRPKGPLGSNVPDETFSQAIDEAYIRNLFPLSSSSASVRFDVSVRTTYRVS